MRQAGSLTLFTPPKPPVWAWDSPSAVPSCRITAAGYGLRQTMALVQAFTLRFPGARNYLMQEPQESDAIIAIVDDDPSARQGLQRLVRSVGWKAETFASAQEFLAHARIEPPSCGPVAIAGGHMKCSGPSVAPRARSYVVVGACVLVLLTGQGCRESSKPAAGITITLIHQLWSDKGSQQWMNETLQTFTARSGIRVEVLPAPEPAVEQRATWRGA